MGIAKGDGTELYVAPTLPYTDIPVGQVVSVTPHGGDVGTYDITNLDSTGGREYTKTIGAGGTLDFMVNYNPQDAGQVACQSMIASPTTAARWSIVLPTTDSDYASFIGHLTAFGAEQITVDGIHMRTISVQISSTWTFATGY
jgi:hypothetical protein